MKIRIKGNSLRYRLTKSDVNTFVNNGYIQETTSFGDQLLIYALKKADASHLTAEFKNNQITVLMPDTMVDEWHTTDIVGFESNTTPLYLLVEKDFVCLDNVLEDQRDNYPNPNMDKCWLVPVVSTVRLPLISQYYTWVFMGILKRFFYRNLYQLT